MRKVQLYIAATLDGYIARLNGQVDFLETIPAPESAPADYGYADFYALTDTTLMGYETYKFIVESGHAFPYPDKQNFVFSRHSRPASPDVEFVKGDALAFVQKLKAQEGQNIWLVGGGQINALLLNAGLIDEILLTLFPVVLGAGIPLFASNVKESFLSTQSVERYSNGVLALKLLPHS
ncbi:MAG: dihydrofolate reductase [Microscillaceae bacterium]|nr:dihydrofolate reductase [Microscillaceae bacterium]